jgi:hypothetical protein
MNGPAFTLDTLRVLEATSDDFPYVTGVLEIPLNDMAVWDYETLLDTLSERFIGNELLMDITFKAVGVTKNGDIQIEVSGDVSAVMHTLM